MSLFFVWQIYLHKNTLYFFAIWHLNHIQVNKQTTDFIILFLLRFFFVFFFLPTLTLGLAHNLVTCQNIVLPHSSLFLDIWIFIPNCEELYFFALSNKSSGRKTYYKFEFLLPISLMEYWSCICHCFSPLTAVCMGRQDCVRLRLKTAEKCPWLQVSGRSHTRCSCRPMFHRHRTKPKLYTEPKCKVQEDES